VKNLGISPAKTHLISEIPSDAALQYTCGRFFGAGKKEGRLLRGPAITCSTVMMNSR
jgi:hypothetical protein